MARLFTNTPAGSSSAVTNGDEVPPIVMPATPPAKKNTGTTVIAVAALAIAGLLLTRSR